MDPSELVLSLAIIGVIAVLGVLILRGRGSGRLNSSVNVGPFSWSFELSQETRQEVTNHLHDATDKFGTSDGFTNAQERLASTTAVDHARVLWVDDHPDNNVEETLMLQGLGLSVTHTTTTTAALRYLAQGKFELLITDLGRDGDPEAGLELLQALTNRQQPLPSIVYTMHPGERAGRATALGASAVIETPGDLLDAVLDRLGR